MSDRPPPHERVLWTVQRGDTRMVAFVRFFNDGHELCFFRNNQLTRSRFYPSDAGEMERAAERIAALVRFFDQGHGLWFDRNGQLTRSPLYPPDAGALEQEAERMYAVLAHGGFTNVE